MGIRSYWVYAFLLTNPFKKDTISCRENYSLYLEHSFNLLFHKDKKVFIFLPWEIVVHTLLTLSARKDDDLAIKGYPIKSNRNRWQKTDD